MWRKKEQKPTSKVEGDDFELGVFLGFFFFVCVCVCIIKREMSMEIQHYRTPSNVPSASRRRMQGEDDEEALKWAALERLPTYDRARKGVLHGILGDLKEIDLRKLGYQERKDLLNKFVKDADDNGEFLKKLKERIDRCIYDHQINSS